MDPVDVLRIATEEQVRARSIVAGLETIPLRLSRATTELGAFSIDRASGACEIRISKHIREEAQVRETARHEFAHQAAWERYGHLGHGVLWQTLAIYLGCEPVPCSAYELSAGRERYAITCGNCGWATTRQRRSKLVRAPWRFACSSCGGKLDVAEV